MILNLPKAEGCLFGLELRILGKAMAEAVEAPERLERLSKSGTKQRCS